MKQQDIIIILLISIKEISKQIHYSCNNYSEHLLADRVCDNIDDYIDRLKESILGNDQEPFTPNIYLQRAIEIIPDIREKSIQEKFAVLKEKIDYTLKIINNIKDLDKADDNIISEIAENIKNSKGLINLQLKEYNKYIQ